MNFPPYLPLVKRVETFLRADYGCCTAHVGPTH